MPSSALKKLRLPRRFRSIQGVRRFVADVLVRLDDGQLDTDKARVLLYGSKVLAELVQQSTLEERVKALEERAARRPEAVQ